MGFYNKLCPGCMNEVGEDSTCAYCGFDLTAKQTSPFLAYDSLLAGKYVIGDVLEQNGDGVTYLGLDTITNNCVRIREFLPDVMISRAVDATAVNVTENFEISYKKYLKEFLDLWHKLKNMRNLDCMISVLDVFEANGTAYAIAEADGSMTLSDYLEEHGGILDWDSITDVVFPAFESIENINNQGIIHGGISPDTLFLCGNGKFKLWGFSINQVRNTEGTLTSDIRPGYAALEQYGEKNMECGAYTDVYGIAAVLYRCITGKTPIDAQTRSKDDTLTIPASIAREIPEHILAAFIGALQVLPTERTQNIAKLKASFTKEEYEKQKNAVTSASTLPLVDPLSEMSEIEDSAEEEKSKPVIVSGNTAIPVLKKGTDPGKQTSTSSTIILSVSIVAVMVIFFVCLALTGIVSFNISGASLSTAKVVTMPDFNGKAKSDEEIQILAQDYDMKITLTPSSSTTVAKDVIFEQDIPAGTKIATGSAITLTYSTGASTVTLPNFTGMTFTETVYYLGKLNLSYNIVEKDNTGSGTAGTIAEMSPAAGSVVYEGTEITLNVWGDAVTTQSSSGTVTGPQTGSQSTSSTSILDSIFGSLSDSVSGLGDTITGFFN